MLWITVAPEQVVDIVHALGEVVLLAPKSAASFLNDPSLDEAGELGAALAGVQPGTVRNLPRGCRLPQDGEREINAPFLGGERFQVALEVLRVLVHQVQQFGHELTESESGAEAGHDGEQPGAAARENFQRSDRTARSGLARHLFPQNGAFVRGERS